MSGFQTTVFQLKQWIKHEFKVSDRIYQIPTSSIRDIVNVYLMPFAGCEHEVAEELIETLLNMAIEEGENVDHIEITRRQLEVFVVYCKRLVEHNK